MGMYDYVNIARELLPVTDEEYEDMESDMQSKSFSDGLKQVYILPSHIEIDEFDMDWNTNDTEHPWGVSWKPINERRETITYYDSPFNFYTDGKSGKWYEFQGQYMNGILEIIRVS